MVLLLYGKTTPPPVGCLGKKSVWLTFLVKEVKKPTRKIRQAPRCGQSTYLLCVSQVSNDAEALGFMNDTAFGLTSSVWSANKVGKRAPQPHLLFLSFPTILSL